MIKLNIEDLGKLRRMESELNGIASLTAPASQAERQQTASTLLLAIERLKDMVMSHTDPACALLEVIQKWEEAVKA